MIYCAFFQLLYLGGRTNRYCTIAITRCQIAFCYTKFFDASELPLKANAPGAFASADVPIEVAKFGIIPLSFCLNPNGDTELICVNFTA